MKFIKRLILLSLLLLVVFVFPSKSASQIPGEGLTISLPLLELTLKSGESYPQTIKITNPTNKLMEVYPVVMNFKAKGEGGEPVFYPATDEEENFSLAHWIRFEQSKIALTPEQVVEFKYRIEVPADAEPGGHYGVIFFATEPPDPSTELNQVAIASMVGSLQLIRTPGAIVEKAFLEEFSANAFYFKPPIDFVLRIANLGNVHFKPEGDVVVKSWRGRELAEIKVNEKRGNILPDSTRRFDVKWETENSPFYKIPIGRLSANFKATYGEAEKEISGQTYFWVIPWWLIIAVLIVIILVFVIIVFLRKRKKRKVKEKGMAEHPFES